MSLIPVVHLDVQTSPEIFEKILYDPYVIFKGLGKMIHPEEKNLNSTMQKFKIRVQMTRWSSVGGGGGGWMPVTSTHCQLLEGIS
jgi:hypothetical protein